MSTPDQHTDLGRHDPATAGGQQPDTLDRNPRDTADPAAPRTGPGPDHDPDAAGHDATRADPAAAGGAAAASPEPERERLVPADRAESYTSRWNAVKGTFVDEPRQAVAEADTLVGELLEEMEALFREQRRYLEQGLDADEASTEDLRMALRRYRSFFDRLLSL